MYFVVVWKRSVVCLWGPFTSRPLLLASTIRCQLLGGGSCAHSQCWQRTPAQTGRDYGAELGKLATCSNLLVCLSTVFLWVLCMCLSKWKAKSEFFRAGLDMYVGEQWWLVLTGFSKNRDPKQCHGINYYIYKRYSWWVQIQVGQMISSPLTLISFGEYLIYKQCLLIIFISFCNFLQSAGLLK